MSIPKPPSPGEERFALHCNAYGLNPIREYRLCADFKYKLDFAWPDKMIAMEIDGGNWNGGHSRGVAYESFCRKINLANDLGWRVYRATTAMVESGYAIDTIRKAMGI